LRRKVKVQAILEMTMVFIVLGFLLAGIMQRVLVNPSGGSPGLLQSMVSNWNNYNGSRANAISGSIPAPEDMLYTGKPAGSAISPVVITPDAIVTDKGSTEYEIDNGQSSLEVADNEGLIPADNNLALTINELNSAKGDVSVAAIYRTETYQCGIDEGNPDDPSDDLPIYCTRQVLDHYEEHLGSSGEAALERAKDHLNQVRNSNLGSSQNSYEQGAGEIDGLTDYQGHYDETTGTGGIEDIRDDFQNQGSDYDQYLDPETRNQQTEIDGIIAAIDAIPRFVSPGQRYGETIKNAIDAVIVRVGNIQGGWSNARTEDAQVEAEANDISAQEGYQGHDSDFEELENKWF